MPDYLENFRQQLDIPDPTLSPQQRRQRRYSWRNERNLYKRKCDLTDKEILAIYPENAPFPVYSPEAWYSDDWNPLDYGQDFDFSRPFFEQFYELQQKVPRIANIIVNTSNCDYCNIVGESKNCYLLFGSIYCEDCLYGNPYYSKNCIDSLVVRNSELCYECIDCDTLYECFYCQDCSNSRNLQFCYDVSSSEDCFFCVGIRRGKYQIFNQNYTKEEYEEKVEELKKQDPEELRRHLLEFRIKTPVRFMFGINNENVNGDHVSNSKNCKNLFYCQDCEDVYNATQIIKSHDVVDSDFGEFGEFLFECSGFFKCSNLFFCHWCWEVSNLYYCSGCTQNSKDSFGCIGLKHNQYCILNKQYSKQKYEEMLFQIIEHMRKTGEWGQFFPEKYSPFSYDETVAGEYFPFNKEEDSESDRPFKLTQKEIQFYEKYDLQKPKNHPDKRHRIRLSMRNPMKIRSTTCDKCHAPINTTYPEGIGQIVYCENCYIEGLI